MREVAIALHETIEAERLVTAVDELVQFHWTDVDDIVGGEFGHRLANDRVTDASTDDDAVLVFVLL